MSLNPIQLQTLVAIMDRIIPEDDFPCASKAGVPDYFTRQFALDLQPVQPSYVSGLDSLDKEARHRYAQSFSSLSDEQQDSLLRDLEQGVTQVEWQTPARKFFQMVIHHTSEGYYADPGNGGNRDGISWKMIGFVIREGNRGREIR